ncbi:MAG TPA: L,D-transpeptidase [Polyangia bacterium]|nr:L,D-transpeptidase [Polyangia bacterium]
MTKPWARSGLRAASLVIGCALAATGCRRATKPAPAPPAPLAPPKPARPPIPARAAMPALAPGETWRYDRGVAKKTTVVEARAAGLLDVDLGDAWAPFIFQDSSGAADDPPKPNAYRETFVALANEKVNEDGQPPKPGEHNYLEVFGIPPTLSVLAPRLEEDVAPAREACYDRVDRVGLEQWTGNIGYLDRDRSKREYLEALRDADWVKKETDARAAASVDAGVAAPSGEQVLAALRDDPKARGRVDRFLRGQSRLRAVRALQARMTCEGLLSPRSRYVEGQYDLPTHEALATWERKHDIFGWGMLGGETLGALLQPNRALLYDDFWRVAAERVADAAGIVEDGSINQARRKNPPTYKDDKGVVHVVPDLIGDHVRALLAAVGVATPEDLVAFLRAHRAGLATLHVAFAAPPLPAYYKADPMALSVEIDRGDVWYDVPFDGRGRPLVQRRDHYPHLTLFTLWRGQKIPLCWWRTTIGSWRSEVHADGHVYMKYKNSDVGPRVWKNIVAAPVWVPPDGTPAKDLLTTKVLDRKVGPVTVVNTDVMGPGFQSAYGLVLAIHVDPRRGGFDNQIRTHGSDDYTSIARRFSHGCHRLVNNRAVRLYDFVLRHRRFKRQGNVPASIKRRFEVDGKPYRYELKTRGYYYELDEPVAVNVLEGRIMGAVKQPITAYVRKPGVDYSDLSTGDAATSTGAGAPGPGADLPPGASSELGP